MIPLSDFHTHSTWCDGKNTLREMVDAALEKGLYAFGFSGHSPMVSDCEWCIADEKLENYFRDATALKEEYKDKINALVGLELDVFSPIPSQKFDYLISSVHYIKKDGAMLPIDLSQKQTISDVEKYYGGDYYAYTRDYFELVSTCADRVDGVIVGHFDLVTKFNEGDVLFDTTDERYLTQGYAAIDKLLEKNVIFEVNTGAMSRGYRTEPYPSIPFLRYIKEKGGRVILSGDCHNASAICHAFDLAYEHIKKAGLEETEKYPILRV